MPTYTYRRPDGTTFDVFQRISDDALTKDPETGVPVQRVISGGAGLQFKGEGFYITDYARKGKGSGTKASESSESSNGNSSSETKTSPKSEAKAESTSKSE